MIVKTDLLGQDIEVIKQFSYRFTPSISFLCLPGNLLMMQVPVYLPGDDIHFRLMQMSSPPLEITKWILWIIQQSLELA